MSELKLSQANDKAVVDFICSAAEAGLSLHISRGSVYWICENSGSTGQGAEKLIEHVSGLEGVSGE